MTSRHPLQSPRQKTAIVCDDDPMVRRIVMAVLDRCGYTAVEGTALASEAVELAEAMQPGVIVLDLSLDEENGLDAIPDLRRVAPESPIVVYSGAETMKDHARAAGAHVVVDKVSPANLENLEAGIRSLPDT